MRGRAAVWGVGLALAVLHFVLHLGMGIGGAAPDLLTVALLLLARESGIGAAGGLGLLFGLLEDALSVLAFGANAVTMTLLGIGGGATRDLFVGDSLVFLVSYFVLGKLVRDLLHWVLMGEALRGAFLADALLGGLLGGAYAAAVGVLVMALTGLWREAPR